MEITKYFQDSLDRSIERGHMRVTAVGSGHGKCTSTGQRSTVHGRPVESHAHRSGMVVYVRDHARSVSHATIEPEASLTSHGVSTKGDGWLAMESLNDDMDGDQRLTQGIGMDSCTTS